MGGSDFSDGSSDSSENENHDRFADSIASKDGLLGMGLNAVTDNVLTKGLTSGIGMIGKGIGGLAGFG